MKIVITYILELIQELKAAKAQYAGQSFWEQS